jgi:signal peptidase I
VRAAAEALLAVVLVAIACTHGVLFVEGGSMEPALVAGDLILYRRVQVSGDRGDLVVFRHGGTLVVHRVAGVLGDGSIRTAGDANDTLNAEPVETDDVCGEVVAVVPAGRISLRLAGLGH